MAPVRSTAASWALLTCAPLRSARPLGRLPQVALQVRAIQVLRRKGRSSRVGGSIVKPISIAMRERAMEACHSRVGGIASSGADAPAMILREGWSAKQVLKSLLWLRRGEPHPTDRASSPQNRPSANGDAGSHLPSGHSVHHLCGLTGPAG